MVQQRSSSTRLSGGENVPQHRAWRRRDDTGTGQSLVANAIAWEHRDRDRAGRDLAALEAAWTATSNPALLLHALEGVECLEVKMPPWLAEAVRTVLGALLAGPGIMRRGSTGRVRRSTGAQWWAVHQQDLIDLERRESVLEVRQRFGLTWQEAARVVSRQWCGGAFVEWKAVLGGVWRVERNLRAGLEGKYLWTSLDEEWRRQVAGDPRRVPALMRANAELTKILASHGRTREDHEGPAR